MRAFSSAQFKGVVLPPSGKPAARGRMLEAALRLFARQGFNGTSTRDLTSALEVQPSALYAHFASKEDVLAELVELGWEAHRKALHHAVLEAGAEPDRQIAALVRANARFHATYPLLAVVVHEEMHALSDERMRVVRLLRQQTLELVTQVIERGISQQRFDVPNLVATVAAIGAIALRIPHWFEAGPALTIDGLADAQAELVLRMLGAKRRG
jgi:AcrR family transcriptional regulator